jgi:hypothetical protein
MKDEVKNALKTLKTFLGMEVKLEQMMLADGQTKIEAESFEAGKSVFVVVPEGEPKELPMGDYELEDGRILTADEKGEIVEIKEATMEEEPTEEIPAEAPVEAEATPEREPKKTVEIKEVHFSKEDMESKDAEILSLKAEIELLKSPKVEEVVELEGTPKPISFNPENEQPVEMFKIGKGESSLDRIFKQVYK